MSPCSVGITLGCGLFLLEILTPNKSGYRIVRVVLCFLKVEPDINTEQIRVSDSSTFVVSFLKVELELNRF